MRAPPIRVLWGHTEQQRPGEGGRRVAFAGEQVTALTWVVNFRRVRSLRRYRFLKHGGRTVLAEGETEWIFIDADSGRPRKIPGEVAEAFPLSVSGPERESAE